jgi:16S rRNA (cytidine1402-2'-O)-methyltransferase|tara:strand:+ start:2340 stop:3038 length:699 start_codon:yes stop_codon:yes gene_type:complete
MAKLHVVATPIGNLEDITLRALRILKEVDVILCEDTRVTKKLLSKYEIKTPTLSYHSHSKLSKLEKIFELLKEGKDLAMVSDAGTPTISDPGAQLVSKVREKFGDTSAGGVEVLVVPGASALTSALSVAGLPASEFLFLGFLPHKKGRKTLFAEMAESKRTVVFYESPHRLLKTLESLSKNLTIHRKVSVSRELSKLYEDTISGSVIDVLDHFKSRPDTVKGEFVIVVSGSK